MTSHYEISQEKYAAESMKSQRKSHSGQKAQNLIKKAAQKHEISSKLCR
jgi:hypothetical protein